MKAPALMAWVVLLVSSCAPSSQCEGARCACLTCGDPLYYSTAFQPRPYDVDVDTLVENATGAWAVHLQGPTVSYDFVLTLAPVAGDGSGPFGPYGIVYGTPNEVPCDGATLDSCFNVGIPMIATLAPADGGPNTPAWPLRYEGANFSSGTDSGRGHVPIYLVLAGDSYSCDVSLTADGTAAGNCTGVELLVATGTRNW